MKLLHCAAYLAITGTIGFLLGRIIPKKWLKPEKGLFRCFAFEKGGRIYEKIRIRRWQNRLPDMSRILPLMMPPKNLSEKYKERLPLMIRETCMAELVHLCLCVTGLRCLRLWPGAGGLTVTAIHILFLNLPYILIQRYNRPRLIRLYKKLIDREKQKEGTVCVF